MKLPKTVYSQLGPVPVVLTEGMIKTPELLAFGVWDEVQRQIKIDPAACDPAQLSTLFHEMLHIAMTDAGLNNTFTEQQAETVCDVGGSYLAAAVLAGYLKICSPR